MKWRTTRTVKQIIEEASMRTNAANTRTPASAKKGTVSSMKQGVGQIDGRNNAQKMKMFRCELCSVRLPFSDETMKEHMNCKAHNRMKTLYEMELWPGSQPGKAESEHNKVYKFTGTSGSILCAPCGVTVEDSIALLRHQMTNEHWMELERRKMWDLIPKIWYCEVCDRLFGKGKYYEDVMKSTFDGHLKSKSHQLAWFDGSAATKKTADISSAAKSVVQGTKMDVPVPEKLYDQKPEEKTNTPLDMEILESNYASATEYQRQESESAQQSILWRLANFLGSRYMVSSGMVPPNTPLANMPWMNVWLKEQSSKMTLLSKQYKALREKRPATKQNLAKAMEVKRDLISLENQRSKDMMQAKVKFIRENPAVYTKLLEKFGCNLENLNLETQFSTPAPKEELEKEDFTEDVIEIKNSEDGDNDQPSYTSKNQSNATYADERHYSLPSKGTKGEKFPNKELNERESSRYSGMQGSGPPTNFSTESSSYSMDLKNSHKASEIPSHNNPVSNANSDPAAPQTIDTVMLDLIKKAVCPEPKKPSLDVDLLLAAVMQKEATKSEAEQKNMDPRQKLRKALLNQLIAERQQKSQSVDFMSQLLARVVEKKQEALKQGPQSASLDSWSGILNSVLKEGQSRAEEQEVAERWNAPRMCFVWDGDTPEEKDCVMDVSEYHTTLAVQQKAKEEMLQEQMQELINPVLEQFDRPPSRSASVLEAFEDLSAFIGTHRDWTAPPPVVSNCPPEPRRSPSKSSRRRRSPSRSRSSRRRRTRSPSRRRHRSRDRTERRRSRSPRDRHSRDRHRRRSPERKRRTRSPERKRRTRSPERKRRTRSPERHVLEVSPESRWLSRPPNIPPISSIAGDYCVEIDNEEDRVRRLFEGRRVVVTNRPSPPLIPPLMDVPIKLFYDASPMQLLDYYQRQENQSDDTLFEQAYVREEERKERERREERKKRERREERRERERRKEEPPTREELRLFEQAYR